VRILLTRILALAIALVLPAAWLQAQGASQAESRPAGIAASGQKTVQGCLQGSDGSYMLTDKSGRTYQLRDNAKLTAHVGHEVRITTTTPNAIATGSSLGAEATATQQPILTVEQVEHVSGTCRAAAGK
jgi:hypothetical protein